MGKVRNVLFIMCDQLRADHLSCAGHPHLETPAIDGLAKRGVLFPRAYVQSGVCGPSRMSYYTGRYMFSHGATWNRVPLSLREKTIGDYLRPAGLRVALAGKTHVLPDTEGLERYGIEGGSALAALMRAGGFEELDRYDGHSPPGNESGYARYLREQGYNSDDPWSDYVIAADGADGEKLSGWHMRNARLPARVAEEHSETAYMTREAMRFIEAMGGTPWCLHLSYVKPHWPYMAPAPYHALYGPKDCLPLNRSDAELENQHPVLAAYRRHEEAVSFSRPEAPDTVRPTYMGLIRQIDDWLGRLFALLERLGRLDDTLIFFTSDHGDFLGDHWLGEKEMFYEEALRVPFIVHDPDRSADATRGTVDDRFVEAIDVVPTILAALDLPPNDHLVEGRSLLPLLRDGGATAGWRDAVFCELDYSFREARRLLNRRPQDCRAMMVRTERWKYVWWQDFRPMLFDLMNDPRELRDLGAHDSYAHIRREMEGRLAAWLKARKTRVTVDDPYVEARTATHKKHGIYFGVW
ncbi:alkaline phosphatase family protein [Enhydrobacter sp.]|uniref:alkaline phosphatase family protein n=1 Tax=Enhydrobacter sp. TaxID=1894999 RepID=UPI00261F2162|nr:alkaline phosphatase family protein [Enhydrobacter sp.]WIM11299.1 MAG: Putative sulfatase [Enhydrobacter sp.]